MTQAVLADPQFGIRRLMRPYATFAADYQGVAKETPIMVTQEGKALDAQAEERVAGYDPNLVRGLPVPMGSRIVLWLPLLVYAVTGPPVDIVPYVWTFDWRMRNLFDYRTQRTPYHQPKQGSGPLDTAVTPPAPRVVVPASNNATIYVQPEPTTGAFLSAQRVVQHARNEDIRGAGANVPAPLVPGGGTGVIQQGVLDPGAVSGANLPAYWVHEMQAVGDELLIGFYREQDGSSATWDFAGIDGQITRLFEGSEDVGIFAMPGVSP